MMKFLIAAAAMALSVTAQAASVTLDNSPGAGQSIAPFGTPQTNTYGQVFTAPITGTLSSFTLYLDGGVVTLKGGVGAWNGTQGFSLGGGTSSILYDSGTVPSLTGGAYTFAPNLNVTAGNLYVAYLTVFGTAAAGTAGMSLSSNPVAGLEYFVFHNTSGNPADASWDYFLNLNDFGFTGALFSATFNAVPEPATWALMIGGFGLTGFAMRRRRHALAV